MLYVHSYTIVQTRTIHVTHMWPPAHTQHTTTNNNDNDKFDDHNNKEQQEQYHKYHNHHNHHQQPRYHHRQLDNGPNDVSRIVWAIQWVFFFSSCFFFITKQYLQQLWLHYSYGGAQGRRRRGERAQTSRITSFGPLVHLFLYSLCVFFFNKQYLQLLLLH